MSGQESSTPGSSKGKGVAVDEVQESARAPYLGEWVDRKIPVLPLLPADRQLEGQSNYGTWKVLMESVLETHDLLVMVSTPLP